VGPRARAVLIAVALSTVESVVHGGEREDAAKREADKKEALAHFDRGSELVSKSMWDAALAEFLESRRLYPAAGNTQNAALCLKTLGRLDEALDLFEQARDFKQSPTEATALAKDIAALSTLVGTVTLKSNESDAVVTVDGRDRGKTPVARAIRVAAGARNVRVYKAGFIPFDRQVVITGGSTHAIDVKLEPLGVSGRLTVNEEHGESADVVIDGTTVGKTPWQGALAIGDHTVLLRGSGPRGTQPALATLRTNQVTPMVLSLEELGVLAHVEASPSGAAFAIDGVPVGSGRWEGRLRVGAHNLEAYMPGYFRKSQPFQLAVGSERQRVSITLDQDLSADMWKTQIPNRFAVGLELGAPIGIVIGGDVRDACGADCREVFPVGGRADLRAAYELRSGLGFGVGAGYTYMRIGTKNRASQITAVGRPPDPGFVDDDADLRGVLFSLRARYAFRVPIAAFVDAGFLLGTLADTRSGTFTRNGAPFTIAPVSVRESARYATFSVGAAYTIHLTELLRLELGAVADLLVALKQPSFSGSLQIPVTGRDVGTFAQQSLLGSTVFGARPFVGITQSF
jgi:hypothetical protein